MEITEVRVKLVPRSSERLRAFCSITLDSDFVVRDLKIIDGTNGPFVAMPSRKLADRCPRCSSKNHLRAKFCNECGAKLRDNRTPKDTQGRAKLHADIAHPINTACRERIQRIVVDAYQEELERSKQPDYQPPTFDDYEDESDDLDTEAARPAVGAAVGSANEGGGDEKPSGDADTDFSDYNSLIAELRSDAASRRGRGGEGRGERGRGRHGARPAESEGERGRRRERHGRPDRPQEPEPADRLEPEPAPSPEPPPRAEEPTPAEPDAEREAPAPAATEPSPPAGDDDGGFGAGVF